MKATNERKAYVTPELKNLGSFEDMTLASGGIGALDQDFPAGTPFGDLTFSS